MKNELEIHKITRTQSRQKMHTGEIIIVSFNCIIRTLEIQNCLFDDYVKTILTESNNEKNSKVAHIVISWYGML